ncbi:hypothetical protein K8I61_16945 [bacterium]|nr:hypothetical protein [bacterium]
MNVSGLQSLAIVPLRPGLPGTGGEDRRPALPRREQAFIVGARAPAPAVARAPRLTITELGPDALRRDHSPWRRYIPAQAAFYDDVERASKGLNETGFLVDRYA